jgi:hypothetical protein
MRRLLVLLALVVPLLPMAPAIASVAEVQPSSVEQQLLAAGYQRATDPKIIAALVAGELPNTVGANPPGYQEPHACSGYTSMASFADPGDNYTTTSNVCGFYAYVNGQWYTGTIVRFKCYRNGILSQRCRWAWNMVTQRQADAGNWVTVISGDYVWPNNGGFSGDSNRIWGAAHLRYLGVGCRGAIRSTATQLYRVRFNTADSGEQLRNMGPDPHLTGTWANCALA